MLLNTNAHTKLSIGNKHKHALSVVCSMPSVCVGYCRTHSDGLVQRPLEMLLELCSDLDQVDFTARNDDPGHHLLLRSFTLRHKMSAWTEKEEVLCLVPGGNVGQKRGKLTFMASLSLLAKYSCLFSKHSTVDKRYTPA